jgi:hypothetical protein
MPEASLAKSSRQKKKIGRKDKNLEGQRRPSACAASEKQRKSERNPQLPQKPAVAYSGIFDRPPGKIDTEKVHDVNCPAVARGCCRSKLVCVSGIEISMLFEERSQIIRCGCKITDSSPADHQAGPPEKLRANG